MSWQKLREPGRPLTLASSSPYRKRLLERLGFDFVTASPDIDETPLEGESAEGLARRLSAEKALTLSRQTSDALVLGSDQVAALGEQLLGKPMTESIAFEQLRRCSGRSVAFHTAVSLAQAGTVLEQRCVPTLVRFRALSDDELRYYIAVDQPLDCAGSFRWEGLGIALFKALESDDPTALEGLPLIATHEMLRSQGLNALKLATGI